MSSSCEGSSDPNKGKENANNSFSFGPNRNSKCPAQGDTPLSNKNKKLLKNAGMERTSLRIRRLKWLAAGMTVEAALVLPLFLIFFLNIGSALELMRLHGRIETALWETGREICVYGTALETISDRLLGDDRGGEAGNLAEVIGNIALSYTFVRSRVEDYLGAEYLEHVPVQGGEKGLQYLGSELLQEDDCVEIVVTYLSKPGWQVAGFRPFLMENHYCGRLWTGYEIRSGEGQEKEETGGGYFLTENMAVYHKSRECTHLSLKTALVSAETIGEQRNDYGGRYRACAKCARGPRPDKLWISPEGDCYHYVRGCSGLKRTVREISWEEAKQYPPCSRCAR